MTRETGTWVRMLGSTLILLGSLGAPARASVQVGEVAPDFTLQDYTGTPHSLTDYRGKCVLLAFIGWYCPRCILAGPAVEAVWQDLKGTGVFQTLAVDVWNGRVNEVQTFISLTGATFPVLMGGAYLIADGEGSYGIRNDNYLVIDRDGIVRYRTDDGPVIGTRFNDTDVRAVIGAWLPVGVEAVTWETVKGLYR